MEFAFTLPIMALVFLIVIDLGLAVREHQLLQNAAREAARFASLPPGASDADIKQRAVNYCAEEKIVVDPNNVTVTRFYIDPTAVPAVFATRITVSYSRRMLIFGAPILPSGNIALTGVSTFRNLF